jgi:hypothetical protein
MEGNLVCAPLGVSWIAARSAPPGVLRDRELGRQQPGFPGLPFQPFLVIRVGDGNEGRRPSLTAETPKIDDAVFGADVAGQLGQYIHGAAFR